MHTANHGRPTQPASRFFTTLKRTLIVTGLGIMATGCATYGKGVEQALSEVEQGQYVAAEASFKKTLDAEGNDRLLYHLELGVVKHLQNDFAASNELLEQASRIAEDLETTSVTDTMAVMMSNPRQGPYSGADFEKVYINYYKALNYFGLAQQAQTRTEYLAALEGARIESRRLIIRLNDLNTRKGTYAEQAEKDDQLFNKILKIFEKLQGNLVDMDQLQYRDDAMAHYLTGISFEMNGEYDNARISYEKAAKSYEGGFVKQFRLDEEMTEQAWFDAIRMMYKDGLTTKARKARKDKLSPKRQTELKRWLSDDFAQLVVLEHKGLAPQRREMNLSLSANPTLKALELTPYAFATDRYQLAWFYLLYADKDFVDALANYLNAMEVGIALNSFTKTQTLGPLWDTAVDLGVINAIGSSTRVTVPYYRPVKPLGRSVLTVNGNSSDLIKASNPAQMGIQEQMTRSSTDIQLALARAVLKGLTADTVGKAGGFLSVVGTVGKLTAQLTDAAETRNWLLLPQDIRVRRVLLEPGQHELELNSQLHGKQIHRNSITMDVKAGDMRLWRVRSLPKAVTGAAAPDAAQEPVLQTAEH
ncbi:hypothetical protein GCM10011297_22710 [Bacterioplanes sanyensis]|uniref:hypothetical protein n=1 Tax=Bacterioplanes sanyensis TaxID=1249553 RepID=UPI001676B531|nr:hypothetical protein [Bacterioplanes sanyensis]GGY49334.1 hypothetical protein GCM10011297_22710 [Bacterioplanes sanyensis]